MKDFPVCMAAPNVMKLNKKFAGLTDVNPAAVCCIMQPGY